MQRSHRFEWYHRWAKSSIDFSWYPECLWGVEGVSKRGLEWKSPDDCQGDGVPAWWACRGIGNKIRYCFCPFDSGGAWLTAISLLFFYHAYTVPEEEEADFYIFVEKWIKWLYLHNSCVDDSSYLLPTFLSNNAQAGLLIVQRSAFWKMRNACWFLMFFWWILHYTWVLSK